MQMKPAIGLTPPNCCDFPTNSEYQNQYGVDVRLSSASWQMLDIHDIVYLLVQFSLQ